MVSYFSPRLPHLNYFRSFGLHSSQKINRKAIYLSRFNGKEQGNSIISMNNISIGYLFKHYTSSSCVSLRALLSSTTASASDQSNGENGVAVVEGEEMEFNRVNCLVWVLHESARSFSLAVESLELAGTGAELAMAWNGRDVHEWHKRIAYRVAIYALLKMAIEVEVLLSHERPNNPSPVNKILTPKLNSVAEYIESQLSKKNPELVQWFRIVELPRIAGFFSSLLKKWSMEYAGSGVAGIIVAISCCAAVRKLCPGHISCRLFEMTMEDVLIELMNVCCGLVSMDKLHHLATEAGFELEFLFQFGRKVLPNKNPEELEFWIGLAQKKLSVAFQRETVFLGTQNLHEKVQADCLATLGLFAYLGRMTRIFLSTKGIKDLDELVKDFLSYLECGSLFIYAEFSSISVYQLFMEIVTDEIGWLDFYAAFPSMGNQERKRSKQHAIQAEKEIILSNVFGVCYDVFSGFAHFCRTTQQPLDAALLSFLLRSQSLLTVCLEDYWAAYDRSSNVLPKITETGCSDHIPSIGNQGAARFSVVLEEKQDFVMQGHRENKSQHTSNLGKGSSLAGADTIIPVETSLQQSLIRKYSNSLLRTSTDVWMGTQLLFVDIMVSLELLLKQLHGYKITTRERKKLKRTLNDIATLVPITVLMLLPVSAIGHAAMLAAIKKYTPSLIPSPYSSERLNVAKQLERTKKMEVQSWGNLEDPSRIS
ncbi:hypothetical protein JRO89_XS09G0177600 [Xanthoceras sorbifolium]|uniref:LETM1-like protein n=1 Tax=Xanthoceras sorbifolium TaxID=99658 RepID=A0ABQ8HLP1_9ROSI|nr:hypothetical protein JRO89_XS09G0177600 [Xanthoceras sorbifolium]